MAKTSRIGNKAERYYVFFAITESAATDEEITSHLIDCRDRGDGRIMGPDGSYDCTIADADIPRLIAQTRQDILTGRATI